QFTQAAALLGGVGRVAIYEMERAGMQPIDNPLLKVSSEACRVLPRQTDVLVEMEKGRPGPVEVPDLGESIQRLKLRGAGCRHYERLAALGDRLSDDSGRRSRRGLADAGP